MYALLAVFQIGTWALFVTLNTQGPLTSEGTYIVAVGIGGFVLVAIGAIGISRQDSPRGTRVALLAAHAVVLLVGWFSTIYYCYGAEQNWSIRLTHWDAIMVTIGTLTTAGTSGIDAISETARRLMALQMVLDTVLVTVMLAFVLHGLTAGRARKA